MKKLLLLPLLVVPFTAMADDRSPYDVLNNIVQTATDDMIVATGENGDTIIKVAATDELNSIYTGEKTVKFLSADATPYVEDGFCLINTVAEENAYRLFCGTAEDISADTDWAVSIEKESDSVEAAPLTPETDSDNSDTANEPVLDTPSENDESSTTAEETPAESVAEESAE